MKIIQPSYELRTSIPAKGMWLLRELEADARTCYKSEDRITEDGSSAEKLIQKLIESGHEAILEGFDIKVRFICDRGMCHELVRHRLCSFSQESTRYCNYNKGKFGNEITVIEPVIFKDLVQEEKDRVFELYENWRFMDRNLNRSIKFLRNILRPILKASGVEIAKELKKLERMVAEQPDELLNYARWRFACRQAECSYMEMTQNGCSPEIARSVLPNSLKAEINMKANLREWRHVLKLRTSERAHPEMRRLMIPLLCELHEKIPVIFDDIYEKMVVKT